MGGTRERYIKRNKPDSERHLFSLIVKAENAHYRQVKKRTEVSKE
jgi:hypothetical protein